MNITAPLPWRTRQRPTRLIARGRSVEWPRRPLIAGIVNITDDSFSGDGTLDIGQALNLARSMVSAGADIIDVGGESARPNRDPIPPADETRRVLPFIERFDECFSDVVPRDRAQVFPPFLSVNTWRSDVALPLLERGGHILNDMGALPTDANARVCAATGAALLIMHSVGEPKQNHRHIRHENIIATLREFWSEKIAVARAAGVQQSSIILDPGIDFAKPCTDNLRIIRELHELAASDHPILMPISRKRVISEALGGRPAAERDAGTAGLVVASALRGAAILRVHNVELAYAALRTLEAVGEHEVVPRHSVPHSIDR